MSRVRYGIAWLAIVTTCGVLTIAGLSRIGSPASLPPLPATMPSVLGPVPIERVDSIPGDPSALADVRFMARKVRIRRDLSLVGSWQAYYHEQCHLNAFDQNVSPGGEEEEKWCDAVANLRVIELLARDGGR